MHQGRSGGRWGRWLATLALALVQAGCGGGAGSPVAPVSVVPAAPLVTPGTWAVLGSSTAAGVGASPGQGWVALLSGALTPRQVTVQNLARAGTLTYQALPADAVPPAGRPAPDPSVNVDRALGLAPKLLILSFPTNDAVAGYSADETVSNLVLIRQRALAQGVPTVLLSSQPRDALTGAQRAVLADTDRRAATLFAPCFLDVYTPLADAAGGILAAYSAGDGIHLNDAGHRVVFDRLDALLAGGACVRLQAG